MVLVPSLLVSANNTAKIWFARAYGEEKYVELIRQVAANSKLSHALAGIIVSASFIAMLGLVLLFLCPNPDADWGYWIGWGVLAYAFVIGFYGSLSFIRIFRKVRKEKKKPNSPSTDVSQLR